MPFGFKTRQPVPPEPVDPMAETFGYVPPPPPGSFWDQYKYLNKTNPGAFMQLGAGLMAGDTASGLSRAAEEMQQGSLLQQRAREKLFEYNDTQRQRAQVEQLLIAKGFSPEEARAASENPTILSQLLDTAYPDPSSSGNGVFGTQQWALKDGQWTPYVIREDGSVQWLDLGGAEAVPPGEITEAKEGGKVRGKFTTEQALQAPTIVSNAERTLGQIAEIRQQSAQAWATGMTSVANAAYGTPGYDFANRVKEAAAGALPQALATLRGLGAMSEREMDAAMNAVHRINLATSEAEFVDALNEYEYYMQYGMEVARKRAAEQGITLNPAYRAPGTPDIGGGGGGGGNDVPTYNPDTGEFE